ncbi:MAG: fumarylacetoacetate hydrolase family protein [Bryobacterales bacterium]|nr:fumarylacetoacetate hydrolase family protein [Bryobacterales bacterium]
MRLGQIISNDRVTAAVFEGGEAFAVPGYTLLELIDRSEKDGVSLTDGARRLVSKHPEKAQPVIPFCPREVWACGCTYEMSAAFRDAEHGTREGFYRHVFTAERPEIFFKGTSRICVGPGKPIGIRADSKFTAPEPELAVVLGAKGKVLGYTLANDVSAWDIERENPLYLPQSKVYTASCSLGPVIVTADELKDPYSLDMVCTIKRGDDILFAGSTSTSKLNRKIEQMVAFLMKANPVPAASLLLTGTGIIVTEEAALAPGDIVSITVEEIGTLTNEAALV